MIQTDRSVTTVIRGAGVTLLLFLMVLLVFGDVFFSNGILFGQDIVELGYPLAYYRHKCITEGEAPIWNPYIMCGYPQMSSAPFQPMDYVDGFFDTSRVSVVRYSLHTLFAGLLMFLLLRRFRLSLSASLLGGVAFMFSGFFVSKIFAGHGGAFSSGVWIPLTFLCLDRVIDSRRFRDTLLFGAVVGLQLLGEHAQYVFYTLIAAAPYVVYRLWGDYIRRPKPAVLAHYAGLSAVSAVFALMTSAIFTLPFRELTAMSNRAGGTGYDYASSLSLPPANLLTAVFANILGSPAGHNAVLGALYWDAALYIGVVPLLLAIVAFKWAGDKKARYFKWLAVSAIILALGDYLPIYKLIYHIPGFSMVRAPSKILFIYAFATAILAGFGLDVLKQHIGPARSSAGVHWLSTQARGILRLSVVFAGFCSAVLVLMLIGRPLVLLIGRKLIVGSRDNPGKYFAKLTGLYNTQLISITLAALFMVLAALTIRAMFQRRMRVPTGAGILIGLTFLDLMIYANPLIEPVNLSHAYNFNRKEVAFLKKDTNVFRILPVEPETFRFNQGVLTGLESVNGYYPIISKRYGTLSQAIDGEKGQLDVSVEISNYRSKLLDMLNVKYVLSKNNLSSPDLILVRRGPIKIYVNSNVLPRAFLVRNVKAVKTGEEALRAVTSKDFDPARTVVIEGVGESLRQPSDHTKEYVRFTERKPNSQAISVKAVSPAYLFISDQYDPRWSAFIDGKPCKILQANYAFRAIKIPAGQHKVSLVNKPRSRIIGFYLSLIAYIIIAVVLLSMWAEASSARARMELKARHAHTQLKSGSV